MIHSKTCNKQRNGTGQCICGHQSEIDRRMMRESMKKSCCDVCGTTPANYSMTFREHVPIIGGTQKDLCTLCYEKVNNAALREYGRLVDKHKTKPSLSCAYGEDRAHNENCKSWSGCRFGGDSGMM